MKKNKTLLTNRRWAKHLFVFLCSVTALVLIASLISATAEGGHAASKVSLSCNDPRPVAYAARMLEETYGWIITYEDPPYVYDGDLADVTETVRKDLDKYKPGEAPKVFVPKGGQLSFEFDVDPSTQKPASPGVVVQQLLDAYAVSGNPGIFRMETDAQRVHIIAGAVKNEKGVVVPHQSIFDASITIPPQKRDGAQLLDAFCAAVHTASGTRVLIGNVPINLLMQYQTEAGAKNQNAREFLTHELDRMTKQPALSWQLLYDPRGKAYYLNIDAYNGRLRPNATPPHL
jgi:hypothetical protein